MDSNLNSEFEEIMNANGVTGVICTDLNGLVLKASGTANPTQAGSISSIAMQASKLFPELNETPTICIEGESSNCLIKSEDKIVLGIFKSKV